jgi:hypothetical protein
MATPPPEPNQDTHKPRTVPLSLPVLWIEPRRHQRRRLESSSSSDPELAAGDSLHRAFLEHALNGDSPL